MLHFMRKHAKFFYIFFFLVIISFVFLYIGPIDKNSQPVLIEIGKTGRVYLDEYWRAYDRLRDFYREIYKDKFDQKMEEKLNLKDRALELLLEERLLAMKAYEMGITVSDRELQEAITHEPAFQRDGVFRKDIYLRTLQLNRISPRYYEESKRRELMLKKMRALIEDTPLAAGLETKDLKGNEEFVKTLRDAMLRDRQQKLLRSYIETLKKRYHVVVHEELIA